MSKRKLKIAVTGGIGSGKSEVCSVFREHGYKIISADKLAKELLQNNPEVKKKVVKIFGQNVYSDGKLNREYLSTQIFGDEKKLKKMNSIVHPETLKSISKLSEEYLRESDIVFIESALIYEAKREKLFDYILLILSDKDERINRIIDRDGLKKDEVIARMKNQLSDEEKIVKADFVLRNDSTLAELKIKSEFFLKVFEGFVSN